MSSDYNTTLTSAKRRSFSCKNCHQNFYVPLSRAKRGNVKFCSKKCYGKGGFEASKNRVTLLCEICSKPFERKASHVAKINYCSLSCRHQEKLLNLHPQKVFTVVCKICQCTFTTTKEKQEFCSRKCSAAVRSQPASYIITICEVCNTPIKDLKLNARRFCSKPCYAKWKSANASANYSRGKGGKRKDLNNQYFRSMWESNWARYLNYLVENKQIKSWLYEADTFEFQVSEIERHFYTPDFKIINRDNSIVYHEVKGWMDKQSAVKLENMSLFYPTIDLVLIEKKTYFEIQNKFSKVLNWEL